MKEFKTKKANLLFVVLPKDAMNVCIDDNDICFIQKCITKYIGINKGYTLLGKLSEVSEEVAKGLVERCDCEGPCIDYKDYSKHWSCDTAIESLTSIATHLGMELTDNIYILKRK
mgnify:FL=1